MTSLSAFGVAELWSDGGGCREGIIDLEEKARERIGQTTGS